MKFQDNSQGLDRLDKYWGALLGAKAARHPILGSKVNTYVEACTRHHRAPRGRVIQAMICQRFRLERQRGLSINITHLLNVKLAGFSNEQVASFVEQVKFLKASIPAEDLKEVRILYNWLWEKFKNYNAIAREAAKIRRSKADSHRRTWNYLFGAIQRHLDHLHEDQNQANLAQHLRNPNQVPGMPGKVKGDKKRQKEERRRQT